MTLRIGFATLILTVSIGCGGSSSTTLPSSPSPTPSPSGQTATVSIVAGARTLTTSAYAPNPIDVMAGTTITWMNNDTIAHDATANDGSWGSGTLAAGAQFSRVFSTAGTFTYHCTIHPGMVGTVTVR